MIGEADVVHLAGPALAPLVLALLQRRPVVVEHHGYQAVCPNGLLFRLPHRTACPGHFMAGRFWACARCVVQGAGWRRGALQLGLTLPRRLLSRRAAANVCITDHVRLRLRLPRSRVIYHGVPDQSTGGSSVPQGGRATFAFVGRMVAEKGLPLLVEASARLHEERRDFRLLFVGDGPERPWLEAMVASSGLDGRVSFTGFLQGTKLEAALRGVDAVVMPSVWEETAGLAAMEHMMRGRVVIAADVGGLSEVVGAAGLRFTPGDANALAACMRQVLDQPTLRVTLGKRARSRAQQLFALDRMVDDHLNVFEGLRRRGARR
jgi:glycosyltransferase involved in cell wall biosynthesis